jgi:Mn2+/Fe2+ NRAMP family transporter
MKIGSTLGPGLVAAASDNDPTTIAALIVVGANSRYSLSWVVLLLYPMLAGVLLIAGQVGLLSRCGLLLNVKRLYGRRWALLFLVSVLSVNLITLGADLEAGAASLGLMSGIDLRWFVLPYAGLLLALLIFGSYRGIQRTLKYSMALFAAYVFAAFLAHPDWGAVLRATAFPALSLQPDRIEGALAVLGTTLTSYSYVWEVQQEAEERRPRNRTAHVRLDAGVGMLIAVVTFWFIIVASGATLGIHRLPIGTAAEAAAALQPLAGPLASQLFAAGLLASSLIAVPVLAASGAYLLAEARDWTRGLDRGAGQAPQFYLAMAVAIVVGAAISLLGLPPIQLLYWASIAGGIGTPVGLVLLLLVAADERAMGRGPLGRSMLAAGWATTGLITAVSVFFIGQQVVRLVTL